MVSKVTVLALAAVCLVFAEALPHINHLKRCRCIRTINAIKVKDIKLVKIFPQHGACDKLEIIVSTKQGKKLCLNSDSTLGRKLVEAVQPMKMKTPRG